MAKSGKDAWKKKNGVVGSMEHLRILSFFIKQPTKVYMTLYNYRIVKRKRARIAIFTSKKANRRIRSLKWSRFLAIKTIGTWRRA